jgi:hypothetical protein
MTWLRDQRFIVNDHLYRVLGYSRGKLLLQLRARRVKDNVWQMEPNGYVASFPEHLVASALEKARATA